MKITKAQKKKIREYWGIPLQFKRNGEVWGKKGKCWGVLYTPEQLKNHLERDSVSQRISDFYYSEK